MGEEPVRTSTTTTEIVDNRGVVVLGRRSAVTAMAITDVVGT